MKTMAQIYSYIDLGQFKRALWEINEILKLGPSNFEALKLKCHVYIKLGRLQEARKILEHLGKNTPYNDELLSYLNV